MAKKYTYIQCIYKKECTSSCSNESYFEWKLLFLLKRNFSVTALFQKVSILPPYPMEGHWKFLRGGGGGGVLKSQTFEEKYEAKLEFPGVGWGVKNKKPSMKGEMTLKGSL